MGRFEPSAIQNLIRSQPAYAGCKGSVVRVRVTDFMTCHSAELRAGAHVNLILGSQGIDKSTIVCAICLGLAGKPKTLGNALKLQDYIRHGTKSATIEIELYNPDGLNFLIKRDIIVWELIKKDGTTNHGTKSRWYLQGERALPTKVEELTTSLNIQLDNLCQFLTQDRVQDFIGMNSFSLLQITQKAMGNDTLFQRHEKLIELTAKLREFEGNFHTVMNLLKSRQEITKRLENNVKNYKEREDLKAKIAELASKKSWIVYLKSRLVFLNLKTDLETIKQAKTAEEAKLAPIKQSLMAMDSSKGKFQADLERSKATNESFMSGVKRKVEEEFAIVEANVDEENAKLREHQNAEADRLKRMENFTVKINGYEKQLDEIRQKGDLDDTSLKVELRKRDEEIQEITNLAEKDESNRRYILSKICTAELELSQMNNLRVSRMKYLEKEVPDVYEAVQFFSKPENLRGITGRIHEPLILHIEVNDLEYGRIVEKHIGSTELYGFFVEHKDDLKIMLELNRKRKKPVTVTHFEGPKTVPFPRPPCRFSTNFRKKWGFKMSILDLIDGPDYHLAYLCQRFDMQNILIGDDEAVKKATDISEQTLLNIYYTSRTCVTIRQFNYSKSKAMQFSVIQAARVLTTKINATEKHNLHENVKQWRIEEKELDDLIIGRKQRKEELEEERQTIEDKVRDINARIQYRKNLLQRLDSARKQIDLLQRERKNLDDLKGDTDKAVLGHRAKMLNVADFLTREMVKAQGNATNPIVLRKQKHLLSGRMKHLQNQLDEMQRNVRQFEAKVSVLQQQVEQAVKEVETNKKNAIQISNLYEPPPEVAAGKLDDKVVEKELLEARTLWCDNSTILEEYQQKMREIADLSKKKDVGEKKLAEVKEEIEKEKQAWLNPLQQLIETVNRNFGRYFMSMGCVGKVQLQKADDENDFGKYGIKILVKFLTSEPLSELGGTKGGTLQKEGERVISKALYSLALQELTNVPFRVIEEINLGMDAENKARLFNLLCSIAKGPNRPQYFLLTPKMLPPEDCPDNVDFHHMD
ncbi:unnamed protein product [Orchesella dallaii]|uniref:Structural maintenance of chromosomes protein 5 n=1 Tax=Orchesella dallaii TaxID=48710 RepID=A0ABP1QG63_9HEXA